MALSPAHGLSDRHLYRLPAIENGEQPVPRDRELAIRKLFRMAVYGEYFSQLACHPKIVAIMSQLLGEDIKLLQSMSLLKPPGMKAIA